MELRRGLLIVLTALCLSAVPIAHLAQDDVPRSSGRIAFIGSDYNIYTIAIGETSPAQLTDDATTDGRTTRFYQGPTWSNDGRLAYFAGMFVQGSPVGTEVFISADGLQPGTSAFLFEDDTYTYAYWSPANCTGDSDTQCRDLAVLLNRPSARRLVVELVRDLQDEDAHLLIGEGVPFYFSWSPDGSRMVWHRNNERLEIFDVDDEAIIRTFDETPGLFAAPAWSPIDDRVLFLSANSDGLRSNLAVSTGATAFSLVPELAGPTAFSWSPDASKVAYVDTHGALIISDGQDGHEVLRSTEEEVIAFFWSPDSAKLAYLTLVIEDSGFFSAKEESPETSLTAKRQDTAVGIAWSVMDIEHGTEQKYGSFLPTRELMYFLTYFDQFAQSHRVWSPDSRYLIFAEMLGRREVISVLDITQTLSVPLIVADGSIGIWSFQ